MSALTDAATAAYAAELAAAENTLQEQRQALNAAAISAMQSFLGSMTMTQAGLTRVYRDLDVNTQSGVVVWSDGTIKLAAHKRPGSANWHIRLVQGSGSDWTMKSERLDDLGDLGKILASS